MGKKGSHTWDIIIQYHLCPHCHTVVESRKDWTYRAGKEFKKLTCPKCKKSITLTREYRGPIGPLMGDPPKPEFDWNGTI